MCITSKLYNSVLRDFLRRIESVSLILKFSKHLLVDINDLLKPSWVSFLFKNDMVAHSNFRGVRIHSGGEMDSVVTDVKRVSSYLLSIAKTLKNYRTMYCCYLSYSFRFWDCSEYWFVQQFKLLRRCHCVSEMCSLVSNYFDTC